jgi:hypothetical protein
MGKKGKCRDCEECTRTGLSKLFRGTVRLSAAVMTVGVTEVANATDRALLAKVCPICGHRMKWHKNKTGAVAD